MWKSLLEGHEGRRCARKFSLMKTINLSSCKETGKKSNKGRGDKRDMLKPVKQRGADRLKYVRILLKILGLPEISLCTVRNFYTNQQYSLIALWGNHLYEIWTTSRICIVNEGKSESQNNACSCEGAC